MNDAVRARKIAELIVGCAADYRAGMLKMVADELRAAGKHRTARCLDAAAKAYDNRNYRPTQGHL